MQTIAIGQSSKLLDCENEIIVRIESKKKNIIFSSH